MRINDFGVDWHGVLIAIGICLVILTFSHRYSKKLSENIYQQTIKKFEERKKENDKNKQPAVNEIKIENEK